ncbi:MULTISPECIES: tRNA (guanosine(37)-N1)-methyltransferase TrmD [unclassified Facklamia]|uniref:tRNA (guanosine(37)-N1)-methyltransferase TrmD n=1 Tax=Aerococcaceae TaxID=186827 RepID=UPI0013B6BD0C|nr:MULTISPECIES: tRNA (guanosine(37)-N1)-methyltransferase TrmD [unclassified Facklamia]MBS4461903.1 tRNA (guanosine(37)-N1)-methyltransferase TrmD [Aerococcaceae bacterium zg-B36]NEW63563.1 tRNA (guanosine(37)-N1)-methyltransferase TrmD [Facklamia sp. 252]NEW67034.1 tRNA (guanosine(37)-N1)-methyltransferase TrmD [Facklamia sp. 253]QQD66504.1 tRNA (guanosine(37)-N1)-methyltransferase TrmD [Aerococcaceae bacterium zg-252]
MKIDVLTLFPEMFAPLNESLMKEAQSKGKLSLHLHNFRQFAVNKHGHVDDYPYGGGAGMLLRVEPIVQTLESIDKNERTRIVLVDPTGVPFTQQMANDWAKEEHLIFICGHYEGFDERIRDYVTEEVSLGDYVLTNGELPTMVMIDSTVRLIPDVVGNAHSIVEESHQRHLLEHPQYTRPREFRGKVVPDVLLSGHHDNIAKWQAKEAIRKTYERRPDLLEKAELTSQEHEWLQEIIKENELK